MSIISFKFDKFSCTLFISPFNFVCLSNTFSNTFYIGSRVTHTFNCLSLKFMVTYGTFWVVNFKGNIEISKTFLNPNYLLKNSACLISTDTLKIEAWSYYHMSIIWSSCSKLKQFFIFLFHVWKLKRNKAIFVNILLLLFFLLLFLCPKHKCYLIY